MVPLQIIYIVKQTFFFFGDYIENPLHTIGFEGEKSWQLHVEEVLKWRIHE